VLLTLESSIYVRQKLNSKRPLLLLDRSVKELELGYTIWGLNDPLQPSEFTSEQLTRLTRADPRLRRARIILTINGMTRGDDKSF